MKPLSVHMKCSNCSPRVPVDLINIKLMKAGGIHNALKNADIAAICGVECMMGCMLESKLGITASASLAGAKSVITPALTSMQPICC